MIELVTIQAVLQAQYDLAKQSTDPAVRFGACSAIGTTADELGVEIEVGE